jgi:hypothetical protein
MNKCVLAFPVLQYTANSTWYRIQLVDVSVVKSTV